jgi:hypothetical protein
MNKLFNTIAKIVEVNNGEKATVVVENVKIKFTEKSVIVYTYDIDDHAWFKEVTINNDMFTHQIVNLIIQVIKFN